MNKYTIIPSNLRYASAPTVDQEIDVTLSLQNQNIIEYDSTTTISLSDVYENERDSSTKFRPTFKINYLYVNSITGTTNYLPYQYNLYYVDEINSKADGIWKGFPQYYEFDFFRPNIQDQHVDYIPISAYNYNWMFYLTYPSENVVNKNIYFTSDNFGTINWNISDGIPFKLKNVTSNGNQLIRFSCPVNHGLKAGEYVELSFNYNGENLFQVFSLGNESYNSDHTIFNILNVGYTGTTFIDDKVGTLKRVVNPDNITETTSKYYIRAHKVLMTPNDFVISKNGFEKNVFNEEKKYFFSSVTPDNQNKIAQKTSSNSYNITLKKDLNISGILDNQKRPISEINLTIIFKGYSGYFNKPNNNIALKEGWKFNITPTPNSWWSKSESKSNTNIGVETYSKTQNGQIYNFYYNKNLNVGDLMNGEFCEWNDFDQTERIISEYYHKINFNQTNFQTTTNDDNNTYGYYYNPYNKMRLKVFSDYIETADPTKVINIPNYSFFSRSNKEFRWRDIYTYGFFDNLGRGVDYPFINGSHYPFSDFIFRLIPEGSNYIEESNLIINPLIDDCE